MTEAKMDAKTEAWAGVEARLDDLTGGYGCICFDQPDREAHPCHACQAEAAIRAYAAECVAEARKPLVEALRPFAAIEVWPPNEEFVELLRSEFVTKLTVGDFRRAAAALADAGETG